MSLDQELPNGWARVELGTICSEVRNGISTKPQESGDLPILRISSVRPMKLNMADVRYLGADHPGADLYRLKQDDLLFTRYNGNRELVGACARVPGAPQAVVYPDKLIRVRLNESAAVSAYIERAVHAGEARQFIDQKLKTSAGQIGVSGSDLKLMPLLPPPLPEQQRIADKLDTVLARVDGVNDRLARIAPLLKRFRQAVLAAATSGRLTADWRVTSGTSPSGPDLLDTLLADHEAAGGQARGSASEPTKEAHDLAAEHLPEEWAIGTLAACCTPGRPITYGILKPGPELDAGVPYIRVADFPGNRLNLSGIKMTSPEIDIQYKRSRLLPGDLLLSIRGSVGRLIEIPPELENANITQDTARLSISGRLNSRFVYYALLSPDALRRMGNAIRGVAVRGINIGDVRALQVPIPSIEEQSEIVRRVDILFAFADRLEARLQAAQSAASRLTPALLAKAFRGELVPQDPVDEPAAELLKRLAASQASATPPRQGRRPARA